MSGHTAFQNIRFRYAQEVLHKRVVLEFSQLGISNCLRDMPSLTARGHTLAAGALDHRQGLAECQETGLE